MNPTLSFLFVAIAFSIVAIFFFRRLTNSPDPGGLVVRWILTAASVCLWVYLGIQARSGPPAMSYIVPAVAVLNGVFLSVLWTPSIAELISNPFTKWYDGGDEEPELRPLYSIAEAYRKRGHYDRAIQEVHRQLANFPEDYEGWMKIAEIQAVDVKDYDGALETVERVLEIPDLAPKNVAYVLGRVADWAIERSDRDAALAAFERIIERLPGTLEAQLAAQRVAHLASAEHIADMHDPHVVQLKRYEEKIGLRGERMAAPEPENPAVIAQRYIEHLNQHPLDNEAREKLALLYANEFRRLDLARGEFEQLIATPNQLPKNIVHWLNQLADCQMRLEAGVDEARATLQRIIDLFPNTAAASNANVRISQLRLELKQNTQQRTIKLGTYEQKIGLRRMNSSGEVNDSP